MKQCLKEKAANQDIVVAAGFDIEKIMLLPHGKCSPFFYSRRLRVTNFTVTKINSIDTFCFCGMRERPKKGSAKCILPFPIFKAVESGWCTRSAFVQ